MRGNSFFDTNILLYTLSSDQRKQRLAEKLLDQGGYVSVQVLNEAANVLSRKSELDWDTIGIFVDGILVFCPDPLPITAALHRVGRRIARTYRYSFYDSLLIAAALELGVNVLYSEDMQHGQRIERLRIVNPFKARTSN